MKEIWKPVIEYEKYYEVSNLGQIRSITREYVNKRLKRGGKGYIENIVKVEGKIMKQYDRYGYKSVSFRDGKTYLVHRLVYCTFHGKSLKFEGQKSDTIVMHKDDCRHNNYLENLDMGSQNDNIQDCIKKGRKRNPTIDIEVYQKKINMKIANEIRLYREETGEGIYKIGNKFGISYATISRIINNKIWVN